MKLRAVLIGCVDSSLTALRTLLALPAHVTVEGVITRRASSYNSDFADLAPLATAHGVPLLYVEDEPDDAAQAAWLRGRGADIVFCIGWSRLLGARLLGAAPRGVVGFHPAELPANRGRHPIVWALALGLERTASSFFLMESEADSGPLLSQQPIAITADDDAATLYARILQAMPGQLEAIARGLAEGSLQPQPQDASRANHWRKRGADDGRIDWRMDAANIRNLVRALARPYPGAHFMAEGQPVKLWRCAVIDDAPRNLEPGKVLAVDADGIVVKCGRGALRLLEHELPRLPSAGDYL